VSRAAGYTVKKDVPVEDHVTHVTAGAVLHVHADVLRVRVLAHLDAEVVDRGGLGYLPVDTAHARVDWQLCHVNDQVPQRA